MSNQFFETNIMGLGRVGFFRRKGKIGILAGKLFRPRKKTINRLNPKTALMPGR